ncbi:hypothetical protein [Streptomyces sp. WG7]|uniref:hypothetical protein n=1 Tax=Streptomyces sp. WG7 TaxID=3417650 RepID=UPI003CF233CA
MRSNSKPARPNIWRFEHVDPVHVAFADTRVPGQVEAGNDCGESVKAGQVVLSDGVEPVRQALALALSELGRERADVPGECVELGAVSAYGLEPELLMASRCVV